VTSDALVRLGATLSVAEAAQLAAWLAGGATLSKALASIGPERRPLVRSLLVEAGLTGADAVPVLRAIEGAHSQGQAIEPVWTVPGALAGYGHLTSAVSSLVLAARESVVCSTFNFQKSSAMWTALAEVASRGTVAVTVYLDTTAAASAPSPTEVATHLPGARVYRTRTVGKRTYRNHAKFIALDRQVLIVTSANFSASAEKHNIEFGLVVRDPALAQLVQKQLFDLQSAIYERVAAGRTPG
jgi:phospholipase D-like protein